MTEAKFNWRRMGCWTACEAFRYIGGMPKLYVAETFRSPQTLAEGQRTWKAKAFRYIVDRQRPMLSTKSPMRIGKSQCNDDP